MPGYKPSAHAHGKCPVCGKEFTYYVKNRSGRYCSIACRAIAQRKDGGKKTIKCAHCGKEVIKKKGTWPRSKRWCSWRCYNADRKAQYVEKVCKECGKVFSVKKSMENRYKVCSRACRLAHNKTTVTNCLICGKEFKYRIGVTSGKYCSMSCYRKSVGENSLEKAVREAIQQIGWEFEQEKQIGRYSVDFYIPNLRLVIEADGEYWHKLRRVKEQDGRKNKYLADQNIGIIRLQEEEVLKQKDLPAYIRKEVTKHH